MRISSVAAGVYRISLSWGNAYLLTDGSEAALLDTGLKKDRADILTALDQVGIPFDRIRSILLTHAHCDHAGNAAFFAGREIDAGGTAPARSEGFQKTIYAHRQEAPYLRVPVRAYAPPGVMKKILHPFSSLAFAMGERIHPVFRCEVDACLEDGDIIDAPGGALRTLFCPGHTPGHVAYFREKDGILFSGDAILNMVPVRRIESLSLPMRLFTDDWTQARQSAQKLTELDPDVLLAGHGRPLKIDTARCLRAWAQMLGRQ